MGTAYLLTFDLGNVVAAGFGSSTVNVSINNGVATWFTNVVNTDPSGFEWESQSMIWVTDGYQCADHNPWRGQWQHEQQRGHPSG